MNFPPEPFRPRITSKLDNYLVPLKKRRLKIDSLGLKFDSFDMDDLDKLKIDKSVKPSPIFHGGNNRGKKASAIIYRQKSFQRYDKDSNDPGIDGLSNMSPYLHFGQISPL